MQDVNVVVLFHNNGVTQKRWWGRVKVVVRIIDVWQINNNWYLAVNWSDCFNLLIFQLVWLVDFKHVVMNNLFKDNLIITISYFNQLIYQILSLDSFITRHIPLFIPK